jgi:pyruvate/2-oxoglutarate/acetoin dehydrogenase E1 component
VKATPPAATYVASLRASLFSLMESDPRVYLIGEDLLDPYGGAFGVSKGLSTKFPDRVIPTPISEACIVGVGVGMALRGLRPVVEIMFGDFVTLITDQLVNVASKVGHMYGRDLPLPLVVRAPMGGGRGYGPTHSQTLDRLFLGVPGLRVVAPSHFHDPGALLEHAVRTDDGPVLFSENKLLYSQRLVLTAGGTLQLRSVPVPSGYPTVAVRNFVDGPADIAVIGYGGMSRYIGELLDNFAKEEIRVVAVLPALLHPLPVESVKEAVSGSRAVLVVEEGPLSHGWGAEVAARLNEELWGSLRAPVARLGARDSVIPASRELERQVLPDTDAIERKALDLINRTL